MLKYKLAELGITEKEYAVLQAIQDSEYGDGWGPDKCVWSWSANPFENARSAGGVFSSLSKKGLVSIDGAWSSDDSSVQMTDEGFRVWLRATYASIEEVDQEQLTRSGHELFREVFGDDPVRDDSPCQ